MEYVKLISIINIRKFEYEINLTLFNKSQRDRMEIYIIISCLILRNQLFLKKITLKFDYVEIICYYKIRNIDKFKQFPNNN